MRKKKRLLSQLGWTTLALACLFSVSSRAHLKSLESTAAAPELVIQTGHSSGINCAVFAPDGRWLASGGADNSIRIWDVASGLELRALVGHQNWIKSLAVNSKGDLLASGSNDRTVKIWNVASGGELLTLSGHQAAVEAIVFSGDDRMIISGSSDNSIKIWDASSGRELRTLTGHTSAIATLAVSIDGKTLASGSADGAIKLWNLADGSPIRTLNKQTKKITALGFSSDNRNVISGSAGGDLILWDSTNGKPRFTIEQSQTAALALNFISDREVLTLTADGQIFSIDIATGKQKTVRPANADAPDMLFASISKDGKLVGSGAGNRSVEIRTVADGKLTRALSSHAAAFFAVAFSRDGRWLASAANDRTVRLWQIATGRAMPRLTGHTGWVQALAFSPDNRLLASGSNSGEIKLWDVNTGKEVFKQSFPGDRFHAIAFSADGKWIAAAGIAQTIHLVELATKQTRNLTGHEGEVTGLIFVPNSSLIASASTDRTVRLWNATTGAPEKTLATLSGQVNTLAVSPDGRTLAAGTADKKVELFRLDGGQQQTLAGHTNEIFTLSFSTDGRWLTSAGADQMVRIWDVKTGSEIRALPGASGEINGIDFTADSRFLVSANEDGSMNVWNTERGEMDAIITSIPDSDDWLVVTPKGLFDGSHAAWKLLLWRFAQSTFKVSPVESFFNEFYYPGLLADLLANKNPKPKQDIVQKDRRQPMIAVHTDVAAGPSAKREVELRIEIAEAPPDADYQAGSGARDLRLFRNGLLVQAWTGDVLQGAAKRTITTTLPIVAGENEFTAYAFNRDNVKSSDSELSVSGAEALRRQGTAYLFVIGVSKYANSQYNLNYSAADATEVASQMKSQQELLRRYNPVEVISLLNDQATKDNILLALKLLNGTAKGPVPANAPADLAKIKPAQPEDAVIFYFSGHGTAKGDRFYIIPHDLGYTGERAGLDHSGLAMILSHSVSDLELEDALKPLDVDQLLLVIDACNSGQALQAADDRRGPMNARGLAQLAYEKGMYVLTASQSDEVAFESAGLKHSYLAYALIEEGIKSGAADADRNGQIFLNEWFNYATDRVPRIRGKKDEAGKQLEEVDEDEKRVQRPRVFNMREGGAERFVVARLAASAQTR
jgi:WD40 repeat protein